jgi:UrcA family protein
MKVINSTRIGTVTGAIALIAALGLVNSASANGAEEPLTQKVAYEDLNLDSVSGASTLYARLKNAARAVCSPLESGDILHRAAWQSCYNHAIDTAVANVNKAQVTALRVRGAGRAPTG